MSAKFRTFCHGLGLSAQALADYVRVSKRSAEHWFTDGEPPLGVLQDVQRLEILVQEAVQAAVDRAQAQGGDVANLDAYRTVDAWYASHPEYRPLPIQTHSTIIDRTRRALESVGVTVHIKYVD